ncbi:hypothetical protein N7468_010256 [Penicillium chermesinum]|uniref:Uncharacterized protein n=1 Tax=Penicillium chermesinum TaxID=63820 RepID=A0A9W9TC38_9EURO|nr:uncharacterized protein N7468_010256 [Penicillium chermesinum]KAJ5217248.1 hypothetical protein N7468_010256 [Penicillium chermesinum]
MAMVAGLAQQHKTALEEQNLYFVISAVNEVENALRHVPFAYPLFDPNLDTEALDVARDRYHYSEAWRNAFLLYIERVFRWRRGGAAPVSAKYIARSIMEHARCIRKENTYQKQILFSIFLAGAEVEREEDRDFCGRIAHGGLACAALRCSLMLVRFVKRSGQWLMTQIPMGYGGGPLSIGVVPSQVFPATSGPTWVIRFALLSFLVLYLEPGMAAVKRHCIR